MSGDTYYLSGDIKIGPANFHADMLEAEAFARWAGHLISNLATPAAQPHITVSYAGPWPRRTGW